MIDKTRCHRLLDDLMITATLYYAGIADREYAR